MLVGGSVVLDGRRVAQQWGGGGGCSVGQKWGGADGPVGSKEGGGGGTTSRERMGRRECYKRNKIESTKK